MKQATVEGFDSWREKARSFLYAKIHPEEITWVAENETSLFSEEIQVEL